MVNIFTSLCPCNRAKPNTQRLGQVFVASLYRSNTSPARAVSDWSDQWPLLYYSVLYIDYSAAHTAIYNYIL